jgi:signal transduction histidine kinase
MREHISDLLPEADFVPIPVGESGDHLSLATVPARLIPGHTVLPDQPPWSPMQVSLMMAWCWLLLSAAAIGALLFGVVRLSERRAAFVSAVTHELRTPLTTFQLYSDLLANRQTLTDEKQTRYVETLRVEAERLGHLIENVLSWSRLDQSADTELIEQVAWSELLSRIEPSLDDCAGQAGMTLETDRLRKRSEIRFCGNRTAVERILFNLIDNACKYAKHADDKRIHLELEAFHSEVKIRVRDHGPGIPAEIRSTLFEPFTKSATDAARSEAGVGLGLSLCRRLARNMNGDLTLQDSSPAGVTFQLRLPTTG